MAIKVKRKKTTREEAKEPDQIYTFNERVFNYLEQHKKIVLGGLAAILVVIIITTFVARRVSESNEEAGAAVTAATQLLNVPVGLSSETPGEPGFETKAERSQAIQDALANTVGDVESAPAAQLLDALSSAALGDTTNAHDSFEAASRVEGTPLMSLLALQGLAATQAEIGDIEMAEATLTLLAESGPGLEDFAKMEMGRLNEAAGRLEQAAERYNELAEDVTAPTGSELLVRRNPVIVEAARHRAQVLSVVLGVSDVEESPVPEEPAE